MKKTHRILASALVASMMFGLTACGKEGNFTAKKFEKVALENLDAEEWDISDVDVSNEEEINKLSADLMADLEDGIFISRTGEEIMDSDNFDQDIFDIVYSICDIDLDFEKLDLNSVYLKGSMEDEEDYYLLGASLMEFSDANAASAYYQSSVHNLKRGIKVLNAVCDTELDLEGLNKDTFKYNGKNSGHLVIKISSEDLDIDEFDDADLEFTLVFGFYIEGKDVFSVISICANSEGNDDTTEFFKLMGMKNPYELESTEAVTDFINDVYDNADKIAKKWEKKLQNSSLAQTATRYT